MKYKTSLLHGPITRLGREDGEAHDEAGIEHAVLENGGGVAHDEVDGAVDVAVPVKLTAQ